MLVSSSRLASCIRVLGPVWFATLGVAFAAETAEPAPVAAQAKAPTIPLTAFAALPSIQLPRLSPDGRGAVMIQNVNGKSYVVVSGFGAEPKVLLQTDNDKYSFMSVRWAGNQRVLIGASFPEERRGIRTIETRLIGIDRDGTNLKADLTRAIQGDGVFEPQQRTAQLQDRIVASVPGEPEVVLLALDTKVPAQPDIYRLDVRSGQARLVQRNLGGIQNWMADTQGEVRLAQGTSGTTRRVMVKPPASPERPSSWVALARYDASDPAAARTQALAPLGFDADPRFLYALAPVDGRNALVRIDLQDPAFPRETLLADPQFDVRASLIRDPASRRIVGVNATTNASRTLFWDDDARRRRESLERALPGRLNRVVSNDATGQRGIVLSIQGARPPDYFMMDWASGRAEIIGSAQPELVKQPLATPRRIALRSRDGLALEGYLTLPPRRAAGPMDNSGGRPARPMPAILLPHGGPAAADTGGYDYWSQFLASRGWAVLQINFRGSTGYGQEFREAGRRRWGLEMQDDLADGMRWLVDQGIADAGRVCIVGGSYGGYAALMGAVKDPALYRCVVSFAGPTDLRDLLSHSQNFVGYELGAEAEIGTWWGDREKLRQTSPALRAAEIRVPVLLMHGVNDLTVPVEQSRDMAEALQKAGHTDTRYVELPLGNHTLARQQDRVRVLTEMERFLQQNLD